MVSVLTPDDIKQMKAAGCGDEVRAILGDLDKLAEHTGYCRYAPMW